MGRGAWSLLRGRTRLLGSGRLQGRLVRIDPAGPRASRPVEQKQPRITRKTQRKLHRGIPGVNPPPHPPFGVFPCTPWFPWLLFDLALQGMTLRVEALSRQWSASLQGTAPCQEWKNWRNGKNRKGSESTHFRLAESDGGLSGEHREWRSIRVFVPLCADVRSSSSSSSCRSPSRTVTRAGVGVATRKRPRAATCASTLVASHSTTAP